MENNAFEVLNKIDVNEHTEKKEGLTYLSWAWAWAEVKKRFPDADYQIIRDEKGLPYVYDPLTGFMVFTNVTIGGMTHHMWLPVMDGKNKAMKAEPYTYKTKYGDKTVEPATMFDINKTIMRCLTKNLAMFGLGLYIYAGEDLPECDELEQKAAESEKPEKPKKTTKKAEPKKNTKAEEKPKEEPLSPLKKLSLLLKANNVTEKEACTSLRINKLTDLKDSEATYVVNNISTLIEAVERRRAIAS